MRCQGQGNISGVSLIRRIKNIRQCELAIAAGVHQTTVSKLERGIPVSPATRRKIAAALEMTEESLFSEIKKRQL
jgi:transcriptional regulator with XRE-family HTH domain